MVPFDSIRLSVGLPLYMFIELILLMAQNKKPEIRVYLVKDPLLSSPVFPAVMLRDRF